MGLPNGVRSPTVREGPLTRLALPHGRASDTSCLLMLQVQLNNRKYRALRIAQYREATNLRNVGWRNILTASRRGGSLRSPITILDSDIDAPVRRHRSHVRLNLHNPADVFFAVNDLGIRRRAAIGFRLPTKELGVKVDRLISVVGQQFVPAKRIRLAFYADSFVFLRFPDAECGAGRIGNHRHSADI